MPSCLHCLYILQTSCAFNAFLDRSFVSPPCRHAQLAPTLLLSPPHLLLCARQALVLPTLFHLPASGYAVLALVLFVPCWLPTLLHLSAPLYLSVGFHLVCRIALPAPTQRQQGPPALLPAANVLPARMPQAQGRCRAVNVLPGLSHTQLAPSLPTPVWWVMPGYPYIHLSTEQRQCLGF